MPIPCSGELHESLVFQDIDLADETLREAEFVDCTFERVRLSGALLCRVSLESCRFSDCDLSMVKLDRTQLDGVHFERCKLMGIDWTHTSLSFSARFDDSVLDYGVFAGMNLSGLHAHGCSLKELDLHGTNLRRANLHESDLSGARFERTDLTRADLSTARGYVIVPGQNTLSNTRFSIEAALTLAEGLGVIVPR